MKNSKTTSLQRTYLLFVQETRRQSRSLAWIFGVGFLIVLSNVLIRGRILTFAPDFYAEQFNMLLIVAGMIEASLFFSDGKNRMQFAQTALLPATYLEKYLARSIWLLVAVPVLLWVGFLAAVPVFQAVSTAITQTEQPPFKPFSGKLLYFWWIIYLIYIPQFLIGSLFFKRYGVWVSIAALQFLSILIARVLSFFYDTNKYSLFGGILGVSLNQALGFEIPWFFPVYFCGLFPLLLVTGYFLFKEKEIQ